jgi:WD40 repeat protein
MKNLKLILSYCFIIILSSSVFAQNLQFSNSYTECKGHRTTVNDVEYSPDGNILYSCGGAYQIIAFNSDNGSQLFSATDEGNVHRISINKDGSLLVSGGYANKNLRIYNANNLKVVATINDFTSVDDLCFSPINNHFAVVGALPNNKQAIVIYDADVKGKVKNIFTQGSGTALPTCLTYSQDGKYIAAGFANETTGIYIYDAESGSKIRYIAHSSDITDLEFSPDGQYIAGGGIDNNVNIWTVSTGSLVKTLKGLDDYILTIDYSPDGSYIVAAGMDHTCVFKMWNVSTGSLVQSMDQKGPDINALLFSPDGQSLAVALRTYGDLFEVTTTAIYKTSDGVSSSSWYEVASSKANLRLEFPVKPEEASSGDQYYGYYDYTLNNSGLAYQVRVTEYKYSVTSSKRSETINKKVDTYKAKLTNPQVVSFSMGGETGKDVIGMSSGVRYHYRFIFIGNIYYYLLVTSRSETETPEETRFFNSFKQY